MSVRGNVSSVCLYVCLPLCLRACECSITRHFHKDSGRKAANVCCLGNAKRIKRQSSEGEGEAGRPLPGVSRGAEREDKTVLEV